VAKRDKRTEAMRQNPRNVRPDDLDAVLKAAGYQVRNQSGSHKNYQRGSDSLVIPQHKPFLKPVYVRAALDALAQHADTDNDEEDN